MRQPLKSHHVGSEASRMRTQWILEALSFSRQMVLHSIVISLWLLLFFDKLSTQSQMLPEERADCRLEANCERVL